MKKASLSLHHLTAMDVGAAELVSLASQARCVNVCLFTYMPPAFRHKYPLVDGREVKAVLAQMQQHSIGCLSLEVFPLTEDADFDGMEESLSTGAELGASFATVHSHLTDDSHARDDLGRLSGIAAEYGIRLAVEFNPFSKITTLAQAVELIEPLGSGNIGLVLDTLHTARSGVSPADIAAARNHISFVQISDGPAKIDRAGKWNEAMRNRMVPGSGDFPLAHILGGFQSDLPVSIEVPQTAASGPSASAKERVIRAVQASCKTLEAAGFTVGTFDLFGR